MILATRYTSSNEIHQLAKLERDKWDAFIRWAEEYEFEKLEIPRPDAVLYLDMKYEIASKLIGNRSEQTGQARDIHENCSADCIVLYHDVVSCNGGQHALLSHKQQRRSAPPTDTGSRHRRRREHMDRNAERTVTI